MGVNIFEKRQTICRRIPILKVRRCARRMRCTRCAALKTADGLGLSSLPRPSHGAEWELLLHILKVLAQSRCWMGHSTKHGKSKLKKKGTLYVPIHSRFCVEA